MRMHRRRRGGRASMPDVTIATSGHDVADARLHREVEALTRQQLTVELLGLGDPSDAPAVTALRTWRRSGPAGRLSLALTLPWRARGRVLMTLDPDLVPAAWVSTRLRRRSLVVDVHEDYQALLADRSWAGSGVGRPLGAWSGWRTCLQLARISPCWPTRTYRPRIRADRWSCKTCRTIWARHRMLRLTHDHGLCTWGTCGGREGCGPCWPHLSRPVVGPWTSSDPSRRLTLEFWRVAEAVIGR